MFGFIKNWIKPKTVDEVKKEYKKVQTPKDKKTKANWIVKSEEISGLEEIYKAHQIIDDILTVSINVSQNDCPSEIIYRFKQLLEIGNEEAIKHAIDMLSFKLSPAQQENFINEISSFKEYKEWRLKQRTNKIQEDF